MWRSPGNSEGGLVRLHTLDGSAHGAGANAGRISSALTAKDGGGHGSAFVPSRNLTGVQSDARIMDDMERRQSVLSSLALCGRPSSSGQTSRRNRGSSVSQGEVF